MMRFSEYEKNKMREARSASALSTRGLAHFLYINASSVAPSLLGRSEASIYAGLRRALGFVPMESRHLDGAYHT